MYNGRNQFHTTHELEDKPAILLCSRIGQLRAVGLEACERARFVGAHELCVADNIHIVSALNIKR